MEERIEAESMAVLAQGDDALREPDVAEPDLDVAAGEPEGPARTSGELANALSSAILALEVVQGTADPEARSALGAHCETLWRALKDAATLEDGSVFDAKAYQAMVDSAAPASDMADWLAELPASPSLYDFLTRRPGADS
ncbi:MAG: hypothetical protein Q7T73_10205 [Beijerinckiaceae bacterium]|nr:hypothetical protein [Beijerinckiaceae bacterium]